MLMNEVTNQGLKGWVKLSFDITEKGLADNIEVTDSSPNNIFDAAAICSLRQWKFKPKIENGKPARATEQLVQLNF